MASLNLCQFIGNVGADPEIRTFEGGNRIAQMRIAVTERYVDRNQQQQERTEWVGLVFNGRLVDIVEKYVHKGSQVYVSGKWHNREWQDQSGNKQRSTELTVLALQLLDKREAQPQAPAPAQPARRQPAPPQYQQPTPPPAPPQQYIPQPSQAQYPGFEQDSTADLPFSQSPGV